jgi:hypothetical protein
MCAMFFSGLLVDVFGSYNPVFLVLSILAAAGIAAVLLVRESNPC